MRSALVLEGGAMRGLFTAGVIDVMMENNVEFNAVCGVSAGAAFGCNYKSRQIGRVIRYNTLLARNWRYCSVRSLLLTGDLYGAKFCWHTLPDRIDVMDKVAYDANPMRFIAVSTDANTGRPVYHDCPVLDYKNLEYMRASASMPIVSKPVEVDGLALLDGGIADSIPVAYMASEGYARQVVVMTQPRGYRKSPQRGMRWIRRALRSYPAVAEALRTRADRYNQTLDRIREMEKDGRILPIYPPEPLRIGKIEHDPEVMRSVYRIGRETGAQHIESVKQYLDASEA